MNLSANELHTIDLARGLWQQRKSIASGWHGFGVVDDQNMVKRLTLYAESSADLPALNRVAASINTKLPVDILQIPRFRYCGGAAPSIPQPLQPGQSVFAKDGLCGRGASGTITAFLQHVSAGKDDPILLLSACHVLARDRQCRNSVTIRLDAGGATIGTALHPVELQKRGNKVDAAVVELQNGIAVQARYQGILVTSKTPAAQRPVVGAQIEKLGFAGPTKGKLLFYCPKIEVIPGAGIGSVEFEDQMLIASSNEGPFVQDGDSGSLVVS